MLRLQVADLTEIATALRVAEAIAAMEPVAVYQPAVTICNGPFGGLYFRMISPAGILMQAEVEADISEEDVACALPHVVLPNVWRSLPPGPAEVIVDQNSFTVRTHRSRVQFPAMEEDWLPPVQPAGTRVTVHSDPFRRALSAVSGIRENPRGAGRGPTWPTTCVHLVIRNGLLQLEAANSWAAMRCTIGAQSPEDTEAEALLPYDTPRLLRALPPNLGAEITLFFDKDNVWVLLGKLLLRLPTTGGQFPDIGRFFAQQAVYATRAKARDLLQIVGAIAPVAKTHFAPSVIISGEEGTLKFSFENKYEKYFASATLLGEPHYGDGRLQHRSVPFQQLATITRGLTRLAEKTIISVTERLLRVSASGPYGVELEAVTVAEEVKEEPVPAPNHTQGDTEEGSQDASKKEEASNETSHA